MQFNISGTTMQTVSIDLQAGETVYSQRNVMGWMTDTVQMNTHTGGGLLKALKRSFSGGGMFVVDYTASAPARIAFAARFPGQILPFTLKPGESLVCRKETFLCAEKSVQLDIAFQQRLGAGLFGGEGFILQKVTGPGRVWLQSMPIMNLAEEIGKFLPQNHEARDVGAGGIAGAVIGGLLRGGE